MTKNQIEYQKLLETKRSNLATEQLTHYRDLATERYQQGQLHETGRHNSATEFIQQTQNAESHRHNVAVEEQAHLELGLKTATLGETIRSNKSREYETYRSNVAAQGEINRHNLANELEAVRHNTESEYVARHTAGSQRMQARSALTNAQSTASQARTSAQRLDLDKSVAVAQVEKLINDAKLTELEIAYANDENIRKWIETGSETILDLARSGKDIVSILRMLGESDFSKVLQFLPSNKNSGDSNYYYTSIS